MEGFPSLIFIYKVFLYFYDKDLMYINGSLIKSNQQTKEEGSLKLLLFSYKEPS
jgi:hypothetical protein